MPSIHVLINAEEKPFDAVAAYRAAGHTDSVIFLSPEEIEMGALPSGMVGGKTSLSFCFTLPDGKVVIVETSLRAMNAAMLAFNAVYAE